MAQFSYKAKDARGQVFEGVVEARGEEDASGILEDKGLAVIFLERLGKTVRKKSGF